MKSINNKAMRVIKTKHFPFGGYKAINIFGIEYLIIRLFHIKQHDAYKDVSFEEEAHINDDNLNYISERKHYTWTKYLGINSSKTA